MKRPPSESAHRRSPCSNGATPNRSSPRAAPARARYISNNADGESVFWIKGDNATFEQPGGKSYQCRFEIPG